MRNNKHETVKPQDYLQIRLIHWIRISRFSFHLSSNFVFLLLFFLTELARLLASTSLPQTFWSSTLKSGGGPVKKWWNLRSDATSCCPLICRLCRDWLQQRFSRFVSVIYQEVIKIFLIVAHHWHCWNSQATPTHAGQWAQQDPLHVFWATLNAPLPLCGCWYCSICVDRTWRNEVDTRQEPTKL